MKVGCAHRETDDRDSKTVGLGKPLEMVVKSKGILSSKWPDYAGLGIIVIYPDV